MGHCTNAGRAAPVQRWHHCTSVGTIVAPILRWHHRSSTEVTRCTSAGALTPVQRWHHCTGVGATAHLWQTPQDKRYPRKDTPPRNAQRKTIEK